MPEKSVRDMSDAERRFYSLPATVFNATVLGSLLLGFLTFLVGLGLYTYVLVNQYISQVSATTRSMAMVIEKSGADIMTSAATTMSIYRSLDEKDLAGTGTEDYHRLFSDVSKIRNNDMLAGIMKEFDVSDDIDDLYIGMYDIDRKRIVYIADAELDPETRMYTGDWEDISEGEIEKFMNWDGEGRLYYIENNAKYGWICTAGVPIKDASGEIVAFVYGDITLENVADGMKTFALLYFVVLIIATLIYGFMLNKYIKKRLVQPINSIADAALDYAADKKKGVVLSNHFSRLNIHTGDEIENLSLIMADMESDIADYVENLTSVTAEKERIGTELSIATNIQTSMLPNKFPAFPDRNDFDVYAFMRPAKEVGGDFYDFFLTDNDHLAMVMADVSGKGVPAAMFMMTARTMLKDAVLSGMDPAAVLFRVNAQLCENNREGMFVTVWLGILQISTGRLVYADAGHEKPMICRGGEWKFVDKRNGVALAAFDPELLELDEEPAFKNSELVLGHGDVIFQYTDGVTEAMKSDREQFGTERLLESLKVIGSAEPAEVIDCVKGRVDRFVDGAAQFDDITMLAVKMK
ncbi:MAG: SpoIIE family protein phosphatase [Lachnospiraceae bacterium]|nr:SpoIIE family protein phosphatase [Lachnospiraceae bacterium]